MTTSPSGTGPSEGLGIVVEATWTTRLYLFDFEDDNIAVYVMDHPGRFSLDDYDAVIRTIQFDRGGRPGSAATRPAVD